MDVPRYWAEASARHEPAPRRQVTISRFGWSSVSQEAAERHARERADEALEQFIRGGRGVPRRERKVPYNGADGLPIREEIVGEPLANAVITRNGYGALCLNTSNVLFADIDRPEPRHPSGAAGCVGIILGGAAGIQLGRVYRLEGLEMAGVIVGGMVAFGVILGLLSRAWRWGAERAARAHGPASLRRVEAWCRRHPDWSVRVYETPAGLRLLALHDVFDPRGEEARAFLRHVGADPIFARMCDLQACFRARVSPKPWRIGIPRHFHPGGTWPVTDPQKLERRRRWVEEYEGAAAGHASCRFLTRVGGSRIHPEAEAVRQLHDTLCQATSSRPIA